MIRGARWSRSRTLAFAAALLCAQGAPAQPNADVDRLAREVTALERQASDPSLTIDQRQSAADRAMERRARLIDAAAGDPRRISWGIDQSAAVLTRLSRDAADTTVLYAVPTAEQRERVHAGAAEAIKFLDAARAAAGAVTEKEKRLSLRNEAAGDLLLAAVRDEQVRGAFVRGRAHVLLAAGAPNEASRLEHAQASIDALGGILMEDPAAEAARRANLGAALLQRGVEGDARAAMPNFEFVCGDGRVGATGVLATTVAEALLGRLFAAPAADFDACIRDLDRSRDRSPRVTRGRHDPIWAIVFADAIGRSCIDRWAVQRENALLARAFEPHQGLLDGPALAELSPEDRRTLVWSHMDALVARIPPPLPLESLPPLPVLARALSLSRQPASTGEAERLLAHLADRPGAGAARADALWELCVLAESRGDGGAASGRALQFARDFEADPRGADAMAFAVHHARERARAAGSSTQDRGAYRDALLLATSRYTRAPRIDDWRLELAQLLLDSAAAADRESALALLEAIPPRSAVAASADELYERAQSTVIDEHRARIEQARAAANDTEVRRLAAELAPVARRAAAWAGSRSRPSLDRFLADRADAQVDSGEPDDALGVYRDLLARGAQVPGGAARLGLGLGRVLLMSGDEVPAFAALRGAVTSFDAGPAGTTRPPEYWHAWTLMLEVLAGREEERAGAVRVQARRLETIDPTLGGEPWRTRIRAAAERATRAGGG